MAHRCRSMSAGVTLPMFVDGGAGGLENSRHHPLRGLSTGFPEPAPTPCRTPDEEGKNRTDTDWKDIITGLVVQGDVGGVWMAVQELRKADASRRVGGENAPITRRELSEELKGVRAELQKLQKGPQTQQQQPPKTWASVAAGPTPGGPAPKMVPARHAHEVVVRAPKGGSSPSLAARTPAEVIHAVRTATGRKDAVAARKMKSGDTIITVDGPTKWYTTNEDWVTKAFGEGAATARRTYAVIAKGMPTQMARRDRDALREGMTRENQGIVRCHPQKIRRDATRAQVVIEMESTEAATKICTRGLILEAQVFQCEPYSPELQPRQCFKCYRFGHIAKFCEKTARCGHCAATAHEEGEAGCPTTRNGAKQRCVNCGDEHSAWDRRCRVAKAVWAEAKEAYKRRPLHFEQATRRPTPPPRTGIDEEGFEMVKRRRVAEQREASQTTSTQASTRTRASSTTRARGGSVRLGRPTDLTRAARTNGRIDFRPIIIPSSLALTEQSQPPSLTPGPGHPW